MIGRRIRESTLMVRSAGIAQTTALCMEARLRADRLDASRSTDPNLWARSMISVFSNSEGWESRRRSKEMSRRERDESGIPRRDSKRESTWSILELETLGTGSVKVEQQGRLSLCFGEQAMEGQWRRRASISGDGRPRAQYYGRERGKLKLKLNKNRGQVWHLYVESVVYGREIEVPSGFWNWLTCAVYYILSLFFFFFLRNFLKDKILLTRKGMEKFWTSFGREDLI